MKLIDLTHKIVDYQSVYPGDSQTRLYKANRIEDDGFNNYRLEIGMHSGTHIDCPMHLTKKKLYVNEISLDRFIGEGSIIDARDLEKVTLKEEYKEKIKENSILLILTGNDNNFGTEEYFNNNLIIDKEFVKYLIEKKIKILGIDTYSPDKFPFEIHKMLLENDILIIENLKNLDKLLTIDRFEVIAFPLNIKADSSILRVVAREL